MFTHRIATPRAAAFGSLVASILLFTTPSQGATIQIDITGVVTTAEPSLPAMQALGPFTARILINDQSPDQGGGGGTGIARFDESGVPPAIISFRIDGIEFAGPQQEVEDIGYIRQSTRDILTIDSRGSDSNEFRVDTLVTLPHNFWGAGPFSLTQLIAVTEADFTNNPSIGIRQNSTNLSALGDVTTWSATVIPEPSTFALALLGFVYAAGIRRRR